ncbi:MAG: IclR family transcriptional regulator [Burkholderiaceae bacterium]
MSKFARMTDILDLFSESVTLLTAEQIAERVRISRPTAFRYARELTQAGFLANYAGRYSLGARIITLDHRIRESDPVLRLARDVMAGLASETACGVILCRMYNEDVINVHHEAGFDEVATSFGRGRPLPLFRGAGSKIMLAYLPQPRLKRIYERHRNEPQLKSLAGDWPAFRAYFKAIRDRGHYVSIQEIEDMTIGVAAPVLVPGMGVIAAISLVMSVERQRLVNTDGLATLVKARAAEIADRLRSLAPETEAGR